MCRLSRPVLLSWYSAALIFLITIESIAAQGTAKDHRLALLIGNAAYQKNALANPANDAKDLGALLAEAGFATMIRTDLDNRGMETAVKEFAASLRPGDTALVFYAGHGVEADNANFLVPVDNAKIESEADLKYGAYNASRILEELSARRVGLAILILDACRNNPLPSRGAGSRGLAVMAAPTQTESVIVYSTAPGTTAADGAGRNSVFTRSLLAELPTPGLTVREVFDRVGGTVKATTGGAQVPWLNSTPLSKDFVFFSGEAAEARAKALGAQAQAELDAQRGKIADLEVARAKAKDDAARQQYDIELTTARAMESAKKLESERLAAEAGRLEAERKKADEALTTRKAFESTEASRAAAMKDEAARLRKEYEALARVDDSAPEFLRQMTSLEKALAEIGSRYESMRVEGEKGIATVYVQKAEALKATLVMEPWESQKDFQVRSSGGFSALEKEKAAELSKYAASIMAERSSQEKNLAAHLQEVTCQFSTKTYTLAGSSVKVTIGEYDREKKSWPLKVESSDPQIRYSSDIVYSIAGAPDIGAAYRAFDVARQAGAIAGEIDYVYRRKAGEPLVPATVRGVRVLDLTTGKQLAAGGTEKILFWLSAENPGSRLGTITRFESPVLGVELIIDGEKAGTTPLEVELGQGTHTISGSAKGHVELMTEITITPRSPVPYRHILNLERLPAVRFESSLADVELFLDGIPMGYLPIEIGVQPGVHRVIATAKGYDDFQTTISALAGRSSLLTIDLKKSGLIPMVYIDGGTFTMGSNRDIEHSAPEHKVTLAPFYMGKYEVTQGQYQKVMKKNPSHFTASGKNSANLPVENVSWVDAVLFCNALSKLEGLQQVYKVESGFLSINVSISREAKGYRLPWEAEWEYAARGGVWIRNFSFAGSNDLDSVAWHKGNSAGTTHEVGGKLPNELGLYDMSGNVEEWCQDVYEAYRGGMQRDPLNTTWVNAMEYLVILRGGNFKFGNVESLYSTSRGLDKATTRGTYSGFRVVRNNGDSSISSGKSGGSETVP
ncbi:MAG: SUMF1/EgtB/PvdO family nonheme iron enzyme [Spirochaetes bacterium]|nr:SUMF1/EgtB/PvdO family nonheme iron enzyme [Spirochaetota bacterium]